MPPSKKPALQKQRVLFIDGDPLVYQAAFGTQEKIDFQDGEPPTVVDHLDRAVEMVDNLVDTIIERFPDAKWRLALSSGTSWRVGIYPEYKANRKASSRPAAYGQVRWRLLEKYGGVMLPKIEGDDVLGIWATSPGRRSVERRMIVSVDKDMKTIPDCWNWNPRKPDEAPKWLNAPTAAYFHLYQTLMGDTVDNYPGCPGIGPKKAEALLAPFSLFGALTHPADAWSAVVNAFLSRGLTKEDALVQAQLAHIMVHDDYNPETQEIRLWQPPR
jgi:DNA polymerase-1